MAGEGDCASIHWASSWVVAQPASTAAESAAARDNEVRFMRRVCSKSRSSFAGLRLEYATVARVDFAAVVERQRVHARRGLHGALALQADAGVVGGLEPARLGPEDDAADARM